MSVLDIKGMGMSPEVPSPKLPKLDGLEGKALWKATTQFESMFMDIVMKSMRSTVTESDVMGSSQQTKIFQEMLDQEYSKTAGQSGKFGLADAMYKQMLHKQMADQEPKEVK